VFWQTPCIEVVDVVFVCSGRPEVHECKQDGSDANLLAVNVQTGVVALVQDEKQFPILEVSAPAAETIAEQITEPFVPIVFGTSLKLPTMVRDDW